MTFCYVRCKSCFCHLSRINARAVDHVRSEFNPADYASRGIQPSENDKLERWKREPESLWKSTDEWPAQPTDLTDSLDENVEGVQRKKIVIGGTIVQDEFWNVLFQWFSTWERLRRVVAWLIRVF